MLRKGRTYAALLASYRHQHEHSLPPSAAFTLAAGIKFEKPGNTGKIEARLLRPLLTEAEMSAIAGHPVILISGEQLPCGHLGVADRLEQDEADERNEAILNILTARRINMDQGTTFEHAGDSVGAACYRMDSPERPSPTLNALSKPPADLAPHIPVSLRTTSPLQQIWSVMVLPSNRHSIGTAWIDYTVSSQSVLEQVPDTGDLRLLLQLHELGHTRQKFVATTRRAEHRHEIDADRFAYNAYALLGGHPGIAEAAKAGWCLNNFIEFSRMQHTHLTGCAISLEKKPHPLTPLYTLQHHYKQVIRRSHRNKHKIPGSNHLPEASRRLLGLRHSWQEKTHMPDEQLFITGLTLEAARLYMPKLMGVTPGAPPSAS